MKNTEGSTLSVVSGGFAHGCFFPGAWPATIKGSMLTALVSSLAADSIDSKIRVNGVCLHYSVAVGPKGTPNQFNFPSAQSYSEFGKVFLRIIQRTEIKGKLTCFTVPEDAEKF